MEFLLHSFYLWKRDLGISAQLEFSIILYAMTMILLWVRVQSAWHCFINTVHICFDVLFNLTGYGREFPLQESVLTLKTQNFDFFKNKCL